MLSKLIKSEVINQALVDAFYPYASIESVWCRNDIEADNTMELVVFLKHTQALHITEKEAPKNADALISVDPKMAYSFVSDAFTKEDGRRYSGILLHENCSAFSIKISNLNNFSDGIDEFNRLFNALQLHIKSMFESGIQIPRFTQQFSWLKCSSEISMMRFKEPYKNFGAFHHNSKPTVVAKAEEIKFQEQALHDKQVNQRFIEKLGQRIEKKSWLDRTLFSHDLKHLHESMTRYARDGGKGIPNWYYPYQNKHPILKTLLEEAQQEITQEASMQARLQ